jgi:hypothetical protein
LLIFIKTGGAGRDRTDDLLNAIQTLSQLSYSPIAEKTVYSDLIKSPTSLMSSPTPEIAPPIVPQLVKYISKANEKRVFIMLKVYPK